MATIIPISQADILRIYGSEIDAKVIVAKALVVDGIVMACGGLVERPPDPRPWVFFDINVNADPRLGIRAVKAIRDGFYAHMKTETRDVVIQEGGPYAERLLRLLGFHPTDEFQPDLRDGQPKRIWACRHC